MDLYREEILEEWQNPANFGKLKKADVVVHQINLLCGDEITFYFKIKTGKISEVSFTGNGCAISIAAASKLSKYIKNKEVSKVSKLKGEKVLELIGGQIAPARLKCALLGLEVIKKLNGR